jgi:hypothetical protein
MCTTLEIKDDKNIWYKCELSTTLDGKVVVEHFGLKCADQLTCVVVEGLMWWSSDPSQPNIGIRADDCLFDSLCRKSSWQGG